MGKNPAFQFYPSDWTRDLDDQDLEVEGAWIRICCRLWWSQGKATKTLREWSNILRTHPNKTGVILKTLLTKSICGGEYLDNQNITIISRRMVKDIKLSEVRRAVGSMGGNPILKKIDVVLDNQTDNQNPTPSSSTLLSSYSKINTIAPDDKKPSSNGKPKYNFDTHSWELISNDFLMILQRAYPAVDIQSQLNKMASWLETHPKNRKSNYGKFINNWLSKAQDSARPDKQTKPNSFGEGLF